MIKAINNKLVVIIRNKLIKIFQMTNKGYFYKYIFLELKIMLKTRKKLFYKKKISQMKFKMISIYKLRNN